MGTWRRNDVASTPVRCHVPAGNDPPWPANILNLAPAPQYSKPSYAYGLTLGHLCTLSGVATLLFTLLSCFCGTRGGGRLLLGEKWLICLRADPNWNRVIVHGRKQAVIEDVHLCKNGGNIHANLTMYLQPYDHIVFPQTFFIFSI